jgi:hypothetical protein
MKWFFVILLPLLLLPIHHDKTPHFVEVINAGDNITMEWQQLSEANYVCISKVQKTAEYPRYIQIDCFNSQLGWHIFSTKNYGDGAYKHRDGDVYFIEEFMFSDYGQGVVGKYGPYEAIYQYHLPIFHKE